MFRILAVPFGKEFSQQSRKEKTLENSKPSKWKGFFFFLPLRASLREYIPAVWPLLLYVNSGLGEARPTLPSPLRASACLLFIVAAPPGASA
jgi:hypothetical protein